MDAKVSCGDGTERVTSQKVQRMRVVQKRSPLVTPMDERSRRGKHTHICISEQQMHNAIIEPELPKNGCAHACERWKNLQMLHNVIDRDLLSTREHFAEKL